MKSRRLIAWLIVLVAVAATPIAVRAAYIWRGYWAIGGEWAVIPMGIMAAWVWLDETRRWDREQAAKRQDEPLPAGTE